MSGGGKVCGGKQVRALAVLSAAGLVAGVASGAAGATTGVAAATTTPAVAGKPAAAGKTVKVRLIDLDLVPSAKRVPVEEETDIATVTFVVRNAGGGLHEFVVLRTATAAPKLPVKAARAVETRRVVRIRAFKPGSTKTVKLTLRAGHYLLLCNLPGHYRAGQFADFTVGSGSVGPGSSGGGTGGEE